MVEVETVFGIGIRKRSGLAHTFYKNLKAFRFVFSSGEGLEQSSGSHPGDHSEGQQPHLRVHLRLGGRAAVRDQVVSRQLRNLQVHPQRGASDEDLLFGGLQH